jgi:two-component system response regulator AtoC
VKILVVDDEAVQREMLSGFLLSQGYEVIGASGGAEAIERFRHEHVWLVLLDHRMPDMNGDEVLEKIREINPRVHIIMITAYGAVDTAVRVMKLGAVDFIEKPVDLEMLLQRIQEVEQSIAVDDDFQEVQEVLEQIELPVKIIGSGREIREAISVAGRVASSPWSVLITGETGTGKELFARLIHELSPRRNAPFVEVNCAAIPENLFESELFGHLKGAFTGATSNRKGRFEQAQCGTVFLDEAGELPEALQPKLLRVLQEKRITPVGADTEKEVDVRVIAATNRDLRKMAEQGRFREDLYFRLNVFEIDIPPLRERREDIPELVDFFVERYAARPVKISPPAMDMLMKYHYPGNVRELEHVIQRVVTLARSSVIRPADLPSEIRSGAAGGGYESLPLDQRLAAIERDEIVRALEKHDYVQTRAADSLGISERVLRYKMKKYGITGRSKR